MFIALKKFIFSFILSLMIVFLPLSIVQISSVSLLKTGISVEQEIKYFNFYSVCNAETKGDKKSNKPIKKEVVGNPSLISKVAGFFIGSSICHFLYGFSLLFSLGILSLLKNNKDEDSLSFFSIFFTGIISGCLFYFGWVIVSSIILNIQTVTPNVMGFITWFEYSAYLILLETIKSGTLSLPIFTFLGWFAGHIIQDWLFF